MLGISCQWYICIGWALISAGMCLSFLPLLSINDGKHDGSLHAAALFLDFIIYLISVPPLWKDAFTWITTYLKLVSMRLLLPLIAESIAFILSALLTLFLDLKQETILLVRIPSQLISLRY